MALYNRNSLKNFFRNGNSASEVEFSNLIDSTWNKIEDGLDKTEKEGLRLAPQGTSQKLISIYPNSIEAEPNWYLAINGNNQKGLGFVSTADEKEQMGLFLHDSGNVGIGKTNPVSRLDVGGSFSCESRIGGIVGKVKADAQWHTVLSKLKGSTAFEIMAEAHGAAGDGNYAMAHAIALNANQGSSGKIKVIQSSFRWYDFRDKIQFRWRGTPDEYSLDVKTGKHYFMTSDKKYHYIHLHITSLWDSSKDRVFEEFML
jgi:hypothetical protein